MTGQNLSRSVFSYGVLDDYSRLPTHPSSPVVSHVCPEAHTGEYYSRSRMPFPELDLKL